MVAVAIGPGGMAVVGIGWCLPSSVVPLFTKWRDNNPWWFNNPSLCNQHSLFRRKRRHKTVALGQKPKIQMAPLRELELALNDHLTNEDIRTFDGS